jgi:peptide/nickel transport system substrate-binding protein
MRDQLTRPATVAVAGMLALASCSTGSTGSTCSTGSTTTETGAGTRDSTHKLMVGLAAEPAGLDLTRTDGAAIAQALLYNVYEPLV